MESSDETLSGLKFTGIIINNTAKAFSLHILSSEIICGDEEIPTATARSAVPAIRTILSG